MTLREAEKLDNYDEVDVIEMEGVSYTLIDIIDGIYYLLDLDNPNDFLLMKEEGENLVSLKDEGEFELALFKFRNSVIATSPKDGKESLE